MDDFRAGVTACLRSWSALRTAAESGWGADDSLDKAEDLRNNILEYFDGSRFPPRLTEDDLEDALAIYMEEQFSVVLEDGSERQIANVIWRMYEACHKGDATFARQVVDVAERAVAGMASFPVQIQSTEHDDDDDDDDDMQDDMPGDTEDMEEDNNSTNEKTAPKLVQQPPFGDGTWNATEYASQFLFGRPRRDRRAKEPASSAPAVRQLGQAATPIVSVRNDQVDDDGFAPIQKGKRRTAL
jgi:pre-rRNA-processing protein TSR2